MRKISGNLEKILALAFFVFTALFTAPLASQQSYNLTYHWTVGGRTQYSMYIVGQVTTAAGTQDIRIQYTNLCEVTGEDKAKALYKVSEKSLNYSGTTFDLRSYGVTPEGEQVERTIDAYGRVASAARYGEGSRYYLLPLVLPQVPVRLEGKWKLAQTVQVPVFEQDVTTQVVIVYTFEDINRNYKGRVRKCARIRVDANYLHESLDGNSGVKGAYQGKIFFDLEEMKLVDYQITENRREWIRSENRVRTSVIQFTSLAQP